MGGRGYPHPLLAISGDDVYVGVEQVTGMTEIPMRYFRKILAQVANTKNTLYLLLPLSGVEVDKHVYNV